MSSFTDWSPSQGLPRLCFWYWTNAEGHPERHPGRQGPLSPFSAWAGQQASDMPGKCFEIWWFTGFGTSRRACHSKCNKCDPFWPFSKCGSPMAICRAALCGAMLHFSWSFAGSSNSSSSLWASTWINRASERWLQRTLQWWLQTMLFPLCQGMQQWCHVFVLPPLWSIWEEKAAEGKESCSQRRCMTQIHAHALHSKIWKGKSSLLHLWTSNTLLWVLCLIHGRNIVLYQFIGLIGPYVCPQWPATVSHVACGFSTGSSFEPSRIHEIFCCRTLCTSGLWIKDAAKIKRQNSWVASRCLREACTTVLSAVQALRALGWASIREVIAADDKDSTVTVHSEPGLKCQGFFATDTLRRQKSGRLLLWILGKGLLFQALHRLNLWSNYATARTSAPGSQALAIPWGLCSLARSRLSRWLAKCRREGRHRNSWVQGREREQIKLKTPYLSHTAEDHGAHFRPVWEPGCSFFLSASALGTTCCKDHQKIHITTKQTHSLTRCPEWNVPGMHAYVEYIRACTHAYI